MASRTKYGIVIVVAILLVALVVTVIALLMLMKGFWNPTSPVQPSAPATSESRPADVPSTTHTVDPTPEPTPTPVRLSWTKTLCGTSTDHLDHVGVLGNGDIIAVGQTRSMDNDYEGFSVPEDRFLEFLVTFDSEGTRQTVKELPLDDAISNGFTVGFDGNALIAGSHSNSPYLAKLDDSLTVTWEVTLEDREGFFFPAIAEAPDHTIMAYGRPNDVFMEVPFLANFNQGDGHLNWSVNLNHISVDSGAYMDSTLTVSNDGSVFVVSTSSLKPKGGAIITKVSSDGDIVWTKEVFQMTDYFPGARPQSTIASSQNGIIMAGFQSSSEGEFVIQDEGFVAEFDSDGELVWKRTYSDSSSFTDLAMDSQGNIITVGAKNGLEDEDTGQSIMPAIGTVTRIQPDGSFQIIKSYEGSDSMYLTGIAITDMGDIVAVGRYTSPDDGARPASCGFEDAFISHIAAS